MPVPTMYNNTIVFTQYSSGKIGILYTSAIRYRAVLYIASKPTSSVMKERSQFAF